MLRGRSRRPRLDPKTSWCAGWRTSPCRGTRGQPRGGRSCRRCARTSQSRRAQKDDRREAEGDAYVEGGGFPDARIRRDGNQLGGRRPVRADVGGIVALGGGAIACLRRNVSDDPADQINRQAECDQRASKRRGGAGVDKLIGRDAEQGEPQNRERRRKGGRRESRERERARQQVSRKVQNGQACDHRAYECQSHVDLQYGSKCVAQMQPSSLPTGAGLPGSTVACPASVCMLSGLRGGCRCVLRYHGYWPIERGKGIRGSQEHRSHPRVGSPQGVRQPGASAQRAARRRASPGLRKSLRLSAARPVRAAAVRSCACAPSGWNARRYARFHADRRASQAAPSP